MHPVYGLSNKNSFSFPFEKNDKEEKKAVFESMQPELWTCRDVENSKSCYNHVD